MIEGQQAEASLVSRASSKPAGERQMFIRVQDSHPRSIAKAVSWRILGSIDTFALSFIFTGSFKLAGSIALTEMFTKMFLYYVHERIWSAIPWSQRGQPANRSDAS